MYHFFFALGMVEIESLRNVDVCDRRVDCDHRAVRSISGTYLPPRCSFAPAPGNRHPTLCFYKLRVS